MSYALGNGILFAGVFAYVSATPFICQNIYGVSPAFSIGVMGPVSFSLAMESQGHIAGSASAVLGVLPFFLGSFTSPLVGISGEYSAKPFEIVIFTVSLLSMVFYMNLHKKSLKSISEGK